MCHNTELFWRAALRLAEPVSREAGEVETEHFVHALRGDEAALPVEGMKLSIDFYPYFYKYISLG